MGAPRLLAHGATAGGSASSGVAARLRPAAAIVASAAAPPRKPRRDRLVRGRKFSGAGSSRARAAGLRTLSTLGLPAGYTAADALPGARHQAEQPLAQRAVVVDAARDLHAHRAAD